MTPIGERVLAEIAVSGPIHYSRLIDLALYDPDRGFYATTGRAGRRADFVTSPEVGPLFGAVVARALDVWWRDAGEPAVFRVVEHGAGPGTLARAIHAAVPDCRSALEYWMVERSATQRRSHPNPTGFLSSTTAPIEPAVGVVIANELLDNLPFDIAEHDGATWRECLIGRSGDQLVEESGDPIELPFGGRVGQRAPVQTAASAWVNAARSSLEMGRVVAIDYLVDAAELSSRGSGWLRTFRGHDHGLPPLEALGEQDITADVVIENLPEPTTRSTQAEFLCTFGIDELVDEGKRLWNEAAAAPNLAALAARSRISEREALVEPSGLGGFGVLQWLVE